MKPNAKYEFLHNGTSTRYVLQNHCGEFIKDFPATWKVGTNKGKQYIVFRPTVTPPKAGHRRFTHSFSLGTETIIINGKKKTKDKVFTGVNFDTLTPYKTFGDSKNMGRNDAVLFEFSKDMEKLTIYFFFEQGNRANEIFDLWTAGKICMTVDAIPTVKEKPVDGQNV